MNEKIPVNRLAQEVAEKIGSNPAEVQQFIKDLFAYVEAEVSAGNAVAIPGLGSFSKSMVGGEPIAFEPDGEYAAELNAEFEMFSPVELNDGVTEEGLNEAVGTSDTEQESVSEPASQPMPSTASAPVPDSVPETAAEPASDPAPEPASATPLAIESVPVETSETTSEPAPTQEAEPEEETHPAESSVPEIIADEPADIAVCMTANTDGSNETKTPVNVEIIEEKPVPEDKPIANIDKEAQVETLSEVHTTPLINAIPEQEEEYVIVHGRKSRFWVGFVIGLILGFALGVIAFVAYLVNVSVITPENLFN